MGTSLMVIPQPKKRSNAKALARAKKIDESIRIAWDSLESHLQYTHGEEETMLRDETHAFHKKCVVSYATLLKNLTELY